MKRITLFLASAVLCLAQVIPNRYIVELATEPTASVAVAKNQRFSARDVDVQARKLQIQDEHAAAERSINALGGTATHHFDAVLNGMAVTMTPDVAAQVRLMPGVKSVAPVSRQHVRLDHAVNVHQISQAWQAIPNGTAGAGAGVKIGMLDSGIDITHPGFQGFATAVPSGFPLGTNDAEKRNTNNKVIVSRFYSDPDPNFGLTNTTGVPCTAPDATADCGHGTGTAMIVAGMPNDPQIPGVAPLVGVAPGAWLGNYKVFDDTGSGSDVTILAGLEDAVADGMDVVNFSGGAPVINQSDESGPLASAIQNALNAGTLFVASAGNSGIPGKGGAGSIGHPAVSAAAIAAGGNENERFFFNAVTVGSVGPVVAVEPQADVSNFAGAVTGTVVDVATLDNNGFGCNAFPANSLSNDIALIQRGPIGAACTFDAKVSNARNAGAAGVIVYDHTDEPLIDYTVDIGFDPSLFSPGLSSGILPMLFLGLKDGQSVKAAVAANSGVQGTLDMDGFTALPRPSNVMVDFSSGGPTSGAHIKPDVVAVGDAFITADATANGFPYIYAGGTSFSSPLVTGSIALIKSARPGLTAAQYKSLVVNSAAEFDQFTDGSMVAPQVAGAGILNAMNALGNNLAASPTSIDFTSASTPGGGSGSQAFPGDAGAKASVSQTVTLTNVGSSSDFFTVSFQPLGGGPAPSVDSSSFSIDPGKSKPINVSFNTSGLAAGAYHGFVLINGSQTSVSTRIPYWFGVAGTSTQAIDLLFFPSASSAGNSETIYFRVVDAAGLPFEPVGNPTVTTSNARARVVDVMPAGDIAGTFLTDIVIGRADTNGINTFTISVDNVSFDVVIFVQ